MKQFRYLPVLLVMGTWIWTGQLLQAQGNQSPRSDAAVTYQDVLKLLEGGTPEAEILDRLAKSPTLFTLDTQQIDALKKAGATEKVLRFMQAGASGVASTSDVANLAIILDCSGSMRDRTREGPSKMEAAKRLVTKLLRDIPNGKRLAFLVYGHNVEQKCQAIKVMHALRELDDAGKEELAQQISELRPMGWTPIALSLRAAGQELAKSDGLAGVILITDGMETCNGDPNAEAARLASDPRMTFGIHIVGFGVEPQEMAAVEAIAHAGKGKFYDADSATKLEPALGELARKIEKPAPAPRPTADIKMAGNETRAGTFFNDAPRIGPGAQKGGLSFRQADYYQVPLQKGQEIRAIGTIQKAAFRVGNPSATNDTQTFGVTIYDQDLTAVARQTIDIAGSPTAPSSWKATWHAPSDMVAYVAIWASSPYEPKSGLTSDIYPAKAHVPPAPYALTIKVQPAGASSAATSWPRLNTKAGDGFTEAGELSIPGLATADLNFREARFYKIQARQGEPVQCTLAVQKPFYLVGNHYFPKDHRARYTLTLYDADQIKVLDRSFEIEGTPPDAVSGSLRWTPKESGTMFLAVTCENSGHDVYVPKRAKPPGPGRFALQVTGESSGSQQPR